MVAEGVVEGRFFFAPRFPEGGNRRNGGGVRGKQSVRAPHPTRGTDLRGRGGGG